jgi:hypothetical protein
MKSATSTGDSTSARKGRGGFMKTHHVWWPHMDREPLFNPFVPVTHQRYPAPEPINADEEQEGEEIQSNEAEERSPGDNE